MAPLAHDSLASQACHMNSDELKSVTDPKIIPKDGNYKNYTKIYGG